MWIVVSYIPITKMLPEPELRKACGGSEDSSQIMSYEGFMEQEEPKPMPKGYGTVKLPHVLGQPCLATLASPACEVLESSATIPGMLREIRSRADFKNVKGEES